MFKRSGIKARRVFLLATAFIAFFSAYASAGLNMQIAVSNNPATNDRTLPAVAMKNKSLTYCLPNDHSLSVVDEYFPHQVFSANESMD